MSRSISPSPSAPPVPIFNRNSQLLDKETGAGQGGTSYTGKRLPTWNDLGRPKTARVGTIGFNVGNKAMEFWSGSGWLKLPMKKI